MGPAVWTPPVKRPDNDLKAISSDIIIACFLFSIKPSCLFDEEKQKMSRVQAIFYILSSDWAVL